MENKDSIKKSGKDPDKKKLIGIRITKDLLAKLQEIGSDLNNTPNQMAIQAIEEWVQEYNYRKKFPFLIVTKNIIAKINDILSEDQINSLIDEYTETIEEMFIHLIDTPLSRTPLPKFHSILPQLLGPMGLKWFESLEFYPDKRGDIHVLRGVHYFGNGYSKLMIRVTENIMEKYFNLKLIKDSIKVIQNSVYLEFRT